MTPLVPALLWIALQFGSSPAPGLVEGPDGGEGDRGAEVRSRLAELERDAERASAEYAEGRAEAGEDAEVFRAAIDRYSVEVDRLADRALKFADRHPDAPESAEALRLVIERSKAGPGDGSERAIALLLRDHVRRRGMGRICVWTSFLYHLPAAEELIRAVLEENPHREDRALACIVLADHLANRARKVRLLREDPARLDDAVETRGPRAARAVREADPDRLERRAAALYRRVIDEFGDVPDADGRMLGAVAAGDLARLLGLRVGMAAPEIEGRDADGERFRLSDYRGRVVVLTFSGNWCGPCVEMYPHERKLAERSAEEPLTVLGVNTDEDLDTLHTAIDSGAITWRCWWDGGTDGPITTAWGVHSFPSIYVLDADGIIRRRDVRGDDLDAAIEALLDEMDAAGASK